MLKNKIADFFVFFGDKINRKIFVMRYYYNLPTKNIASVLNINDTTVRTKLFRTREELKSFLINKGYKM